MLAWEAKHPYDDAPALGADAAARVGLAALRLEAGEFEEADRQLAVALALDPSLPPSIVSPAPTPTARS
jgi:hypothetical protein